MRFLTIFLCVLLCGAAGCERKSGPPRPPTSAGTAPVPRIVVLSPALGVIAKDLELESRVVGRHAWDMVLPRSLPVCGDQNGIDYETLLSVDPTHVLLEWGSRELPPRLTALAEQEGWTLRNFSTLTLEEVIEAANAVDQMFFERKTLGAADNVPPPLGSWLERQLYSRPGAERAGRILMLISVKPPSALGPGSAHHQLLVRLGGTPAITAGRPHIVLDAEGVLDLAPDGIILFAPREYGTPAPIARSPEELRELLGQVGKLDIPAVQSGRIAVVDHPLGLIPSTSFIDIAREIGAILERWGAEAAK
jgi:ABC-type Fe3+-hydroxamate transport system substrate-binding protein